jgi:hypothetical protein
LFFQNANGQSFCLFPQFICFLESSESFRLGDIKKLDFQFFPQRFQESEEVPSDSKIIERTWAKVNKDGSPDLRYSGNYQIPVVKYARVQFKHPEGLEEEYYISDYVGGERFSEDFKHYLSWIGNKVGSGKTFFVSKEYFLAVKSCSDKFQRFLKTLQSDSSFNYFISSVDALVGYVEEGIPEGIRTIMFLDILRCFHHVCDIYDFRSKEGFAIMYLQGRCLDFKLEEYSDVDNLFRLQENFVRMYDTTKGTLEVFDINDNEFLLLALLLNAYNSDLNEQYLSLLY